MNYGELSSGEVDEIVRRDKAGLCWDCGKPVGVGTGHCCASCYDPGFVYFLASEDGYVKIGKSKDLKARIRQLRVQLPFKVRLVGVCWSQTMGRVECEFHHQFARKRLNGEWFLLDDEDFRQIRLSCQLSSMAAPDEAKAVVRSLPEAA